MVRPAGEILQVIGGYGFHIYDDSGAPWITISYRTEDAARKARDLIARIKIIAAGELLDRSLRSLYRSSDGVRGLGAAVKNLSHRASRNVASAWLIPRHSGTAHLGGTDAS